VAGALVLLALGLGLSLLGCSEPPPDQALGSTVKEQIPRWAREQGFAGNKQALAGANVFAEAGCTNCHTFIALGAASLHNLAVFLEASKGKH
jgi:hypothetical protein